MQPDVPGRALEQVLAERQEPARDAAQGSAPVWGSPSVLVSALAQRVREWRDAGLAGVQRGALERASQPDLQSAWAKAAASGSAQPSQLVKVSQVPVEVRFEAGFWAQRQARPSARL